MRPPRAGSRPGGWIALEAITAVVLLGVLAASYALLQRSSAALNQTHLGRQRCILAAQAQLECLWATGHALDDAEVARCWPGVRTEVRRQEGSGPWQGLVLATATASAQAGGRSVQVELSRYLAPPHGGPP